MSLIVPLRVLHNLPIILDFYFHVHKWKFLIRRNILIYFGVCSLATILHLIYSQKQHKISLWDTFTFHYPKYKRKNTIKSNDVFHKIQRIIRKILFLNFLCFLAFWFLNSPSFLMWLTFQQHTFLPTTFLNLGLFPIHTNYASEYAKDDLRTSIAGLLSVLWHWYKSMDSLK